MEYISLERSFYSTSAGVCCMKLLAEIAEKSHVEDTGFIFTGAPVYDESLFHILFHKPFPHSSIKTGQFS